MTSHVLRGLDKDIHWRLLGQALSARFLAAKCLNRFADELSGSCADHPSFGAACRIAPSPAAEDDLDLPEKRSVVAMKVLVVHNFYQQAGGEDQVFADEARLLEDHGHTVDRLTMDNDSIVGMSKLTLARKTIWNRDSQEVLKEKIRKIGAEVVHFHNTFPLVSPACYYAAHEAGAAVVQTLHNYRLLCPAATFYRDGHVCEDCLGRKLTWPAVSHKCYRSNRMATGVATAMLFYHHRKGTYAHEVDRYIALTSFSAEKFIAGGLPADRIVVKPNFVDPAPTLGSGKGGFVLFVGRLTAEKGIDTLLRTWTEGLQKTELKIIGDGPLREKVEQAAKGCSTIQYVGRQPPEQVYVMMGDAKALIFPSEWYEGQPRTIVESLAKGTPVIASRLGSMPELIEHGRSGLLFAAGNQQDLSRQVDKLFGADDDYQMMRKEARLEFERKYTAGQNYPLLLDCYQKAMDRFQRRG